MFIYNIRKKIAALLFITIPAISFFTIEAISLLPQKKKSTVVRQKDNKPKETDTNQGKPKVVTLTPFEFEGRGREWLTGGILQQVAEKLHIKNTEMGRIYNGLNNDCRNAQLYHKPEDIKSCKEVWRTMQQYSKELEERNEYELLQKIWILKRIHPWMYDYWDGISRQTPIH